MTRSFRNTVVVLCVLAVALLATQALAGRYRVGPGDVIVVSVHEEPDAGGQSVVSPKGAIQNNLLGNVYVKDMTVDEIQELLTTRLAEYIRNPRVTVDIAQYNARKVYVFGGANHTGPFPLKEDTTLLEVLIADAGGPREGVAGTITILRGYLRGENEDPSAVDPAPDEGDAVDPAPGEGDTVDPAPGEGDTVDPAPGEGDAVDPGETGDAGDEAVEGGKPDSGYETIRIELGELLKPETGGPMQIPLQDGDIINIPMPDSAVGAGERRVFVFGAVQSPGIFRIEGSSYSALNAVLAAGGFTQFASRNRVRLIREINGQKVERIIRLADVMRGQKDKDVIIEPEDTIVVPEGLF